jgi:enoyl-CoA hydratase/carnithine racemase
MLFESAHVRVASAFGIATLSLGFPGEPVNALDAARLRELDAALAALDRSPFVDILVLRSAKPAGFCSGLHPNVEASLVHPAGRAAFAAVGQRVCTHLANLKMITVAFLEGPCLDAGLELALACDYRIAVASLTGHIGVPSRRTLFGGRSRMARRIGAKRTDEVIHSGRTLSGREARALGLVDRACCERRAKIELRTFLDELERSPRIPRRVEPTGLAEERRNFAHRPAAAPVGLAELPLEIALARGFITPLEFEQLQPRPSAAPAREALSRAA